MNFYVLTLKVNSTSLAEFILQKTTSFYLIAGPKFCNREPHIHTHSNLSPEKTHLSVSHQQMHVVRIMSRCKN